MNGDCLLRNRKKFRADDSSYQAISSISVVVGRVVGNKRLEGLLVANYGANLACKALQRGIKQA